LANTDNRKSQRSPVTLRIKFKSATLEQFIERYAVDVSQGGIFIRTKEPLPVGTTMRFEFQLRDESPLITGEGTVVWIREQNAGQAGVAPGMGVRFDRLTEASQGVLDEILAHKAARGANGGTDSVDMPTRVVPAGSIRREHGPPMQFAPDAVPEEAFEQATKVHSLEELASLSARPESTAQIRQMAAREMGVSDYIDSEDDKTKVYPALAKPAGRAAGVRIDLGTSGSTQPLPPTPGLQGSDVELGRAGYEEDVDDDELPFDTREARDMELGLAGPTSPLEHERLVRPDEVELGHAGTVQTSSQARASVRPATPGKPITLGDSGAHDPMSEVPLPEAGHYDLGQAGPTMAMPPERLSRASELELGAAGGTDEADAPAMLPAIRAEEAAQRPAQRSAAAQATAAAASRSPQARPAAPARDLPPVADDVVDDALDSLEDTHNHIPSVVAAAAAAAQREAADELAARRARRDSERATTGDVIAEMDEPGDVIADEPGDTIADEPGGKSAGEAAKPAAAPAASAAAAGGRARSAPIVRVSARNDTEVVGDKKSFPLRPLLAAAALVVIIGGGALYMVTRGDGSTAPNPDPTAVENPGPTAVQPPVTPQQPAVAAVAPDARAAGTTGAEPEIVFEDEPEVPVETVSIEVRSTPPGATAALVDGDQSGPTPMAFAVDKSKKHRVRISHPGFASQEIELDPAGPKPAPVTLAPVPWVLHMESTPPAATIYVEGKRVLGHTPNEFALPLGWEKRKHFKISFRLPGYEKLDILVDNTFQAQGEAMVQTVQGTLVKATVRPRPQPTPPPTGEQPTPPPDGTGDGQQGTPPQGDPPPPAGDTQPPPADPPKPETPPPADPGAVPPAQQL
jgi:uncharacterized protein (TIGR02266 family)